MPLVIQAPEKDRRGRGSKRGLCYTAVIIYAAKTNDGGVGASGSSATVP